MAEDPVRLFDESGSELLKSLLSAARDEQPNQAALQRTLTAVGVGSTLIATASAAPTATAGAQGAVGVASLGSAQGAASATLLIVAKWLGAGAIAGIVATSAIYAVSAPALPVPKASGGVALRAPAAAALVEGRSGTAAPAPAPAPEATQPRAEPEPPAAPLVVGAAPLASVVASSPHPIAVSGKVDPTAQLAAEVALLDAARQALAAGNAAPALRSLNDYDARFQHPNLAPEALYLRLEALTLQGNQTDSEVVARRLLRSYPNGPHAARARAVLGLER